MPYSSGNPATAREKLVASASLPPPPLSKGNPHRPPDKPVEPSAVGTFNDMLSKVYAFDPTDMEAKLAFTKTPEGRAFLGEYPVFRGLLACKSKDEKRTWVGRLQAKLKACDAEAAADIAAQIMKGN